MNKIMRLKYLSLNSKYHIILLIVVGSFFSCQNKQLNSRICEFEILFDSNRDGSREIYVLDKDSKKVKQLTNSLDPEVYKPFSRLVPIMDNKLYLFQIDQVMKKTFS